MEPNFDAELNAFTGLCDESLQDLGKGDEPDAIQKFFEDAKLAGLVGWQATDGFKAEASRIDARAGQILKQERRTPNLAPAAAAIVTDEDHRLEKRYTKGIHDGVKAARIEKSQNGLWAYEFDDNNSLIRGYAIEGNEK